MSIWGKLPPWGEWAVLILIALLGLWVLDIVPNPKRITEYVVNAFVIGAVLGSVITYFYATHEKRIISKVRRDIDNLATYVDLSHLTPRQRAQVDYPNAELVSDKRILEIHVAQSSPIFMRRTPPEPGTDAAERFDILSALIAGYDARHYAW